MLVQRLTGTAEGLATAGDLRGDAPKLGLPGATELELDVRVTVLVPARLWVGYVLAGQPKCRL